MEGLSLSEGCNSFHRGHWILKGPLVASSAEEWYVQKLRVSGIPYRDRRSSDELRCQILWSTSRHLKTLNTHRKTAKIST